MALCITRGACSAVLISSEYTEHSLKSRSGWVSWKKLLPICLLGMCEAMASTGAPERLASYSPLIRCRLPGPQEPAQTASLPVSCASAAAAKAAASSCRTWIQSMPPFAEPPVLPDGVHDRVEAVAHNPVDPLHAGSLELFDELGGKFLGHGCTLPRWWSMS